MNQGEIINSIKEHLDSLKSTVRWALLLSLAFWWAGIQKQPIIKAFGTEIQREQAFIVAVIFYLIVNISIFDRLFRIGDLLKLLDEASFVKGVAKLSYHSWEFSPFAYFGHSFFSKLNCAKGYGLLIIIWWICNSSLISLGDSNQTFLGTILKFAFVGIGVGLIVAINRITHIILERSQNKFEEIYKKIRLIQLYRYFWIISGTALGGAFFYFTLIFVGPN